MIFLIGFNSSIFAGDGISTPESRAEGVDRLAEHIEKNGVSEGSIIDQKKIDQATPVKELEYGNSEPRPSSEEIDIQN